MMTFLCFDGSLFSIYNDAQLKWLLHRYLPTSSIPGVFGMQEPYKKWKTAIWFWKNSVLGRSVFGFWLYYLQQPSIFVISQFLELQNIHDFVDRKYLTHSIFYQTFVHLTEPFQIFCLSFFLSFSFSLSVFLSFSLSLFLSLFLSFFFNPLTGYTSTH